MFQILTDSSCDLTKEQLSRHRISVAPLTVTWDESTTFPDGHMGPAAFYAGIRSGKLPQTAAVNPGQWADLMKPALHRGEDVLVLTLASGVSATYQSAVIAAGELQEAYPQRKIAVVDSTAASLALGLLVLNAAGLRDSGMSLEDTVQWVEGNKQSFCVWLTVEDLMHLKRGGRLGAASAMVGTMLQIKPLLYLNDQGRLEQGPKVRGRKAAMQALVDRVKCYGLPGENDTLAVGHAACREDAELLAQMLQTACGVQNVLIGSIGNVIGAHVGPGSLIVCYRSTQRS